MSRTLGQNPNHRPWNTCLEPACVASLIQRAYAPCQPKCSLDYALTLDPLAQAHQAHAPLSVTVARALSTSQLRCLRQPFARLNVS